MAGLFFAHKDEVKFLVSWNNILFCGCFTYSRGFLCWKKSCNTLVCVSGMLWHSELFKFILRVPKRSRKTKAKNPNSRPHRHTTTTPTLQTKHYRHTRQPKKQIINNKTYFILFFYTFDHVLITSILLFDCSFNKLFVHFLVFKT